VAVEREVVYVVADKIIFIILLIVLLASILISTTFYNENFEERRARVLNELFRAIEEARAQGSYKCCIEPPCTMCYLGEWIWKNGSCYCSYMIVNGEWDKVCPQCIKGIENSKCSSRMGGECV